MIYAKIRARYANNTRLCFVPYVIKYLRAKAVVHHKLADYHNVQSVEMQLVKKNINALT